MTNLKVAPLLATLCLVACLPAQAPPVGRLDSTEVRGAGVSPGVSGAPALSRANLSRRRAALAPADMAGRYELAKWCAGEGFTSESRELAREILDREPDHYGARILLGERRLNGQWVTNREFMEALGFVWHAGDWRPREEIEALLAEREEAARVRRLKDRWETLFRRLTGASQATRDRARDALHGFLAENDLEHMVPVVDRWHEAYTALWDQARSSAVVEIRAQQATLTSLRPLSMSLGVGTPVTLELPTLRKVSVKTTVGLSLP